MGCFLLMKNQSKPKQSQVNGSFQSTLPGSEDEALLQINYSLSLSSDLQIRVSTDLHTITKMALEWVVLGYAAGAEAIMVLLLTLPGLSFLRKGLLTVTRNLLQPFMSIVPFCLFLLMDIYWKFENRPSCESAESCTPDEYLRHQKSIMKSQRNLLLIVSALVFYWVLYSVTKLIVKVEELNAKIERMKNRE